ncbi:hypothetical protein scyTo_0017096 [Scyliorhinus torazame]|uniref:Uncharacterized protein n=1 Tax=Scyliorhinus torazame TaxID=75743 RepID=A0A401Q465_SCYTO|nr:hypothetical protein [Scyliorhinus torazame]
MILQLTPVLGELTLFSKSCLFMRNGMCLSSLAGRVTILRSRLGFHQTPLSDEKLSITRIIRKEDLLLLMWKDKSVLGQLLFYPGPLPLSA